MVCKCVYAQGCSYEGLLWSYSVSQYVNIPTSFYLIAPWSLPRSSSLHEGCRGQPGPPSVSLQSQGLRHKYPTSTATSPLRSDHSLHLRGGTHIKIYWACFSHFHFYVPVRQRWGLPCLSCMCPPFITPILLLSMGPGGSEKHLKKKKHFVKTQRWL